MSHATCAPHASRAPLRLAASACLPLLLLAGCANLSGGPAGPGSAAHAGKPAASAASAASAAASPSSPAFDTVIKDAQRLEGGPLTAWKRDEKVWLELPPEAFSKPFFLSPNIGAGIGESGVFGGLMASRWGSFGKPQLVEFRRVGNGVQMLAVNAAYSARSNAAQRFAIQSAFSPSMLSSAPVASAAHPQRKSVLVDAQTLFVTDLLGLGMVLNRSYRQSYAFDRGNSAITAVRASGGMLWLDVSSHFQSAALAPPVAGSPASPQTPAALPDARSLFVTTSYALMRLPDEPMKPRKADPRVGLFTTTVTDFSDDLDRSPKRFFANHWRLQKKDPQADKSEPVTPITYWLDRSIPAEYREAIKAGVLEWNKAFERLGYVNAIRVDQPEDAAPAEAPPQARAVIRWMTNSAPSFGAIGPSHVDPRSGEILRADIGLESLSSRAIRALRAQILPLTSPSADAADPMQCQAADFGAEQLGLGLDVLSARGDIDPDSPQARQFVLDYLKDTTMHEVGHTLGLRHNFRASRWLSEAQLADAAYTREHGNTASVMEYAPINLPSPGKALADSGTPFQATLGPYDYWAIEYAYKVLDDKDAEAQLLAIAARSQEPAHQAELAYGTDEDFLFGSDPEALQFDLGNDPLAYAAKRIAIVRELLGQLPQRQLKTTEDYSLLRRSVGYALRELSRTALVLTRQVGGVRNLRDFPGSGRDPVQPLPAATQRKALEMLATEYLSTKSLALPPALLRQMAPDFLERGDALQTGDANPAAAFSPAQALLDLQRSVLAPLMSEELYTRMLDSNGLLPAEQADRLTPQALHARIAQAVWEGFEHDDPGSAWRRNLQREHVNRLAALLLRAGGQGRADARSHVRELARDLLKRLQAAQARASGSGTARHKRKSVAPAAEPALAHWRDCADTLDAALHATVMRPQP